MTFTPFDSPLYRDLFHDGETARLFSDTADLRACLLVWGALAKAQAAAGTVPETTAHAIQRAAMEIQIDPGALAQATGQNAVPIPALLAAFRAELNAPEVAAHVHFGATSQDIMDTSLSLRLRQVLAVFDTRLKSVIEALGQLAEAHADTPMAGRTWGQVATPVSFGAVVAGWGHPLLALRTRMEALPEQCLWVSLSGAAGSAAALGPEAVNIRSGLAQGLGLHDPGISWHSDRLPRTTLAAWMTEVLGQLGRLGAQLDVLASSSVGEVRLATSGGSSTMPNKGNPVGAALLQTLARHGAGLNQTLQTAALHRDQRDGSAWMLEWLTLPQLCGALGQALCVAGTLLTNLKINVDGMAQDIDDGRELIFAEALTFELSKTMPRPEAAQRVKEMCAKASRANPLSIQAREAGFEVGGAFTPNLGAGPAEARAFAAAVKG